MKLLVVIVNYRITDLTIACLRSLADEIVRVDAAKVVVCENGTGPEHVEKLRRAIEENGWGGWCELTWLCRNCGFTGGNNAVIRPALASSDPPEYVLLLNGDTLVRPHAVEALVAFMDEHQQVGIAGSRLVNPDGTDQGSPFRFQGILSELDRGLRLGVVSRLLSRWSVVIRPKPREACMVDWVSGASMIIRRAVFEAIGLLDEGLFTYFDDIDFCLNARRAGWPTWYVPESVVVHLEGAASGIGPGSVKPRPKYWFEARRRFFLKNYGPLYAALVDAAFIGGYALWRVRRWLQGGVDTDPVNMLADAVRESVFLRGTRVPVVGNPES